MESARIFSLSITSFDIGAKRVKFILKVQGRTRFLHGLTQCPEYIKSTRHSKIQAFHASLSQSLPRVKLPKCPKKKWLHSRSEAFYVKRTEKLNQYFRQILLIEEVQTSEALFKLVSPKRTYSVGITGGETVQIEKIASLFLSPNSDSWVSRPRSSVFEKFINRSPIDIICNEKIKRISNISIACYTQENIIEFTESVCLGLDGVIVAYNTQTQDTRELALFMERVLWGNMPCFVLGTNDIKNEQMQILDAFQRLFEIIK